MRLELPVLTDPFGPAWRTAREFDAKAIERLFAERLASRPSELTQRESVIDRRDLIGSIHAASPGLRIPLDQEIRLPEQRVWRSWRPPFCIPLAACSAFRRQIPDTKVGAICLDP